MARIKKAQAGKKLTIKRTREVADSLENAGYRKIAASALSKTASESTRDSLSKGGWKDVSNADRYRELADKAKAKVKKMKSGGKSPAWQRKEGKIKPKASNVSKKLGSAKKSIGNMRFAKKKK